MSNKPHTEKSLISLKIYGVGTYRTKQGDLVTCWDSFKSDERLIEKKKKTIQELCHNMAVRAHRKYAGQYKKAMFYQKGRDKEVAKMTPDGVVTFL